MRDTLFHPPAIRQTILAMLLCGKWISCGMAGDLVVIVNKDNPIAAMTSVQVSNLYLGRGRSFPHGGIAHVIDQPRESPVREKFFRRVNGMSLNHVNTFWARLSVSGQVLPPAIHADSFAVLKAVEADVNAIGYIEDINILKQVNIVLRLHD